MTPRGETVASASGHRFRTIAGQEILVDEEGFLVDAGDWSPEVASDMARDKGLHVLEDRHWKVIRFLRDYYLKHGRAPLSREIKQGVGLSLLEIESMFAGGLKYGARRIAGLPNPRGCM